MTTKVTKTHTQKTVLIPTLLVGPYLCLIREALWGLLAEFPEAHASSDILEDAPLKVTRSLRRRLMRICWSTSCSFWQQMHIQRKKNNNKKTAQMSLNCTTVLKLDFFSSPPVYDCVSFLPPRPEVGFYSLEKVFLLLFEPVLALHPSAPIAVPLWRELPGGQTEVFFSALCLLTMTPSGQYYNFPA